MVFGRWTVIGVNGVRGRRGVYLDCRCECGKTKAVQKYTLMKGLSKSCGCLSAEIASKSFKTHGATYADEYSSWRHMISRCCDEKCDAFKWYGGRGIYVCKEWMESFHAFLAAVGARPSKDHSLDRIDPNGSYVPGNVRWATRDVQSRNKRISSKNKTGVSGVSVFGKRFRAYGSINGKHVHIGLFGSVKEAADARKAWEERELMQITKNLLGAA